ncbi:hypothetical protein [Roseinatronobacter sp. NSM]|uniref:hypothetical protein n=1 Tax=Roseinatronobacter sp. NSM TaxID=3457785 RepID=UPI00403524F5
MTAHHDPKGLIRESYRIEGISMGECRSILVDWALSLPADHDPMQALTALLGQYGTLAPDHPMTALLQEGLAPRPQRPRRGRGR